VPEAAVGDQDGDGTNDLFLLWRDKGQVFTRDAAGRFGVEPAAEYDLDIETKKEKRERNAWISPRLLDLNADGVSDLVMIKTAGGMMNMLSSVYVFPGQPGGGFPAKPAQLLTREAFTPVLLFHDVNHDQAKDLIVAAVEIGLVAASQVLLTGSLTVDFDIHLNAQGTFPGTPQATVEIPFQINFKRAADIQGLPPVFGHDFNGDGINDLAHGRGEDALEIYLGAPQEEALFGSHFRVRLKVPPTPYLQATDAARLSAVRELAMQQRALLDAARRGLDDAQRMLGQARAPDFGGYDALGKPQRWAPAGPRHDRRS